MKGIKMRKNKWLNRFITVGLVFCFVATCSPVDKDAIVKTMAKAHKGFVQIDPLSYTFGTFSMDEAYHIQKMLADKVCQHAGPIAGYKVAYASKAAQQQFGMSEPARGPFFLTQRVPSGAELPAEMFTSILLETEIAFTIGKRIDKPITTIAELKPYVKWVHVVFDASNFPYKTDKAKPSPADIVASGTGSHIFVFGKPVDPTTVELENLITSLTRNQEKIREAPARDIMGNPWNSLLWCANHLHKYDLPLEPGMVVFSGTAAKAYKVTGEDIKGRYVGECGPLGKVRMVLK